MPRTARIVVPNYFNKKNNTSGHLWQGRFYLCILDADEDEEDVKNIRKHTLLGRPLGTKMFIEKLGRKVGEYYAPCQEAGLRDKNRNK